MPHGVLSTAEGGKAAICGSLRRITRTAWVKDNRSGSSSAASAASCISPRTAKCASKNPQNSWRTRSGSWTAVSLLRGDGTARIGDSRPLSAARATVPVRPGPTQVPHMHSRTRSAGIRRRALFGVAHASPGRSLQGRFHRRLTTTIGSGAAAWTQYPGRPAPGAPDPGYPSAGVTSWVRCSPSCDGSSPTRGSGPSDWRRDVRPASRAGQGQAEPAIALKGSQAYTRVPRQW